MGMRTHRLFSFVGEWLLIAPAREGSNRFGATEGFPFCAQREEDNFEIGRILHLKSEIRDLKLDGQIPVQLEISDFGFEMQDSSDFKISHRFTLGPACYSGSMSILKFLGINPDTAERTAPSAETETVRKIVQKLDQLPEQQARYIAAFAFLLSRAARADLEISTGETALMERIVMQQGGLPEELALVVVQMAKTQNQLFGSTENYLVTREFERMATREQKLALLDCLFAVAAADETITSEEDNVVKQIASELKLSHDEYISARSRFREYLAVLKPGRRD